MSDSSEDVSRLAQLLEQQLAASAKREEMLTAMVERMWTLRDQPSSGQPQPAIQGTDIYTPASRGPPSVPIPH